MWEVETAALLSQIGCATLPPETATRYYLGEPLSSAEEVLIERLPAVAERLIRDIPRLESICTILADQNKPWTPHPHGARASSGSPRTTTCWKPSGSRWSTHSESCAAGRVSTTRI